jgi:hypothetical protein
MRRAAKVAGGQELHTTAETGEQPRSAWHAHTTEIIEETGMAERSCINMRFSAPC